MRLGKAQTEAVIRARAEEQESDAVSALACPWPCSEAERRVAVFAQGTEHSSEEG